MVKDADIYVGFDSMAHSPKAYPWVEGYSVAFPIPDMGVPHDVANTIRLVDWLVQRLHEGDKIHLGCIGGHGRTGLILSAVTFVAIGEVQAIQYVRKHYCHKAVETKAQVDFLHQVFGIGIAIAHHDLLDKGHLNAKGKGKPKYYDKDFGLNFEELGLQGVGHPSMEEQAKVKTIPVGNQEEDSLLGGAIKPLFGSNTY
jgi:hypothetical protein